jgi:hypothetical protein
MNVLLVFPVADGQTGIALRDSFRQLGHEVRVVDANLAPNEVYGVFRECQPKLVFCSRTIPITPYIQRIKAESPQTVTCIWNTDVRKHLSEWKPWLPLFQTVDYLFTVSESKAERFRREGINQNAFWLPQGVQERVYHGPSPMTIEDKRRFQCDVSFAGGIEGGPDVHGWRVPYHDALKRALPDFSIKFFGCYGEPKVMNDDHNKLAALSRINLGMSMCTPEASKYTSVRDYKVMAAGGFLLTKYSDQMEEWFPMSDLDRVLDTYGSIQEMVDKVKYWLSHEDERKKVAWRGCEWVHASHRYVHRVRTALQIMGFGSEVE